MKKVLFLVESLSGGGAEKVLVDILENIDRTVFSPLVFTIIQTGEYIDVLKKYNIEIRGILLPPKKETYFSSLLYRIMYNIIYRVLPIRFIYSLYIPKDCDVEIAFVEGFSTHILSYSTNKKSKKIAWVHTDLKENYWKRGSSFSSREEEQRAYLKYDKVVCVSKSAKQHYDEIYKYAQNSTSCYNPLNDSKIRDLSRDNASYPKKVSTRLRIISLGRLVHEKGYDRLIKCIPSLIKRGTDVELYIFGNGPQKSDLSQLIASLNLETRVFLVPFISNPYKELKTADLFVCSSRVEGFSLALAEALILGIPVLSTRSAGPEELLNYGEYGLLCDNNQESLQKELLKVVQTPSILEALKQKSCNRSKMFNFKKQINQIEQIITTL